MQIRFGYTRHKCIVFAIFAAVAVILWRTSGYPVWIIPVFCVLLLLALGLKLEMKGKAAICWLVFQFLEGSILVVCSIQYMLLEAELLHKLSYTRFFMNLGVALFFFLVFEMGMNHTALASIAAYGFLLLLGLIDYFVYAFRGNEFTFADIKAAGTGISVASHYRFVIDERVGCVLLLFLLYAVLVSRGDVSFRKEWLMRLLMPVAIVPMYAVVALGALDINTETWEMKGTYRNGFLLNFCLEIRDSFVRTPAGYSMDGMQELEEQFSGDDAAHNGEAAAPDHATKPVIIAIMNESFTDYRYVGELQTNVAVTPFIDSLRENTMKGYALSSVFGAKTANSEWEFLTGGSMAFLPDGAVVYQQYLGENPYTILGPLKDAGYTTVAMHPYYATGWGRDRIYRNMGFDETCFLEDFDQDRLIREYISDEALYDKIIERYEKLGRHENLFLFGITMQNHGGYGEYYDNIRHDVYKVGYSFPDVDQYLQLLHESDAAIEKLISYFMAEDRPVEILFFGDHQPSLTRRFYEQLNGKGVTDLTLEELERIYTVPFFIWTNYETDEKEIPITSLNYLSTLMLERADLELPAYQRFLKECMEVIPAVNSQGYYSPAGGGYRLLSEAEGSEQDWLDHYNWLVYNSTFGGKNRNRFFFP